MQRLVRATGDLYRNAHDHAATSEELVASLAESHLPSFVIWGRRDPYLPVAAAEHQRMAFPDAEVVILEDSGHLALRRSPRSAQCPD